MCSTTYNSVYGNINLTDIKEVIFWGDKVKEVTTFDGTKISINHKVPYISLEGLSNLQELSIIECSLTTVPPLPESLLDLNCGGNRNLESLPNKLPSNLKVLFCHINPILSFIPETMPSTLTSFTCYSSKLTHLPILPETCKLISCDHNQITKLYNLPHELEELYCFNNNIDYIDSFPSKLKRIICHKNKIRHMPAFPAGLETLSCYDNPCTIYHLPESLCDFDYGHTQPAKDMKIPQGCRSQKRFQSRYYH